MKFLEVDSISQGAIILISVFIKIIIVNNNYYVKHKGKYQRNTPDCLEKISVKFTAKLNVHMHGTF